MTPTRPNVKILHNIALWLLFTVVQSSLAGDYSGLLSNLYKQASNQDRPVILVLDDNANRNDLAHHGNHLNRADENFDDRAEYSGLDDDAQRKKSYDRKPSWHRGSFYTSVNGRDQNRRPKYDDRNSRDYNNRNDDRNSGHDRFDDRNNRNNGYGMNDDRHNRHNDRNDNRNNRNDDRNNRNDDRNNRNDDRNYRDDDDNQRNGYVNSRYDDRNYRDDDRNDNRYNNNNRNGRLWDRNKSNNNRNDKNHYANDRYADNNNNYNRGRGKNDRYNRDYVFRDRNRNNKNSNYRNKPRDRDDRPRNRNRNDRYEDDMRDNRYRDNRNNNANDNRNRKGERNPADEEERQINNLEKSILRSPLVKTIMQISNNVMRQKDSCEEDAADSCEEKPKEQQAETDDPCESAGNSCEMDNENPSTRGITADHVSDPPPKTCD